MEESVGELGRRRAAAVPVAAVGVVVRVYEALVGFSRGQLREVARAEKLGMGANPRGSRSFGMCPSSLYGSVNPRIFVHAFEKLSVLRNVRFEFEVICDSSRLRAPRVVI
jgi:hypothetical protein